MATKDKYPENIVNPNFQKLLDKFQKIIEGLPKPEKVKDALSQLKSESGITFISGHQRDAIYARCNNYTNGTYGSTSKAHELHQHVKTPK